MSECRQDGPVEAGELRTVYAIRCGERSQALERWSRWDRRGAGLPPVAVVGWGVAGGGGLCMGGGGGGGGGGLGGGVFGPGGCSLALCRGEGQRRRGAG